MSEQEKIILQSMGNSRFVYNYFLKKQQQLYTLYKEQLQLFKDNQIAKEPQCTFLTAIDMTNQLPQLKKDIFYITIDNFINFASNAKNETDLSINSSQFNTLKVHWLNQGLSTSLQQSIRHLNNSYQRFFKKQSGFPQFKKKSNRNSFTITINNICWRDNKNDKSQFKNKCIVLNKTKTPLDIRYDSPPIQLVSSLESIESNISVTKTNCTIMGSSVRGELSVVVELSNSYTQQSKISTCLTNIKT